ncbi:MAG: potassium transporter TrkG [Pseudomonadota bacterium]
MRAQPIFAPMLAVLALAMALPLLFAVVESEWAMARGFLYGGLFTAVSAGILGLALARDEAGGGVQRELLTLLACWIVLPVFAAIPLMLITPGIGWTGAVFEMVAAFTTTGGSVYGEPHRVPEALHLWRAQVGWIGGFLSLTAAWVVLAPRRLGGFEIEAATWRMQSDTAPRDTALGIAPAPLGVRIRRAVRVILPIYLGLTVALALLLSGAGQGPLSALIHAMGILSTSGIEGGVGFEDATNRVAEVAALAFMIVAATRLVYARASSFGERRGIRRDPEIWIMAVLVALTSAALFLRHWIGALTIELTGETDGFNALWGTIFTVTSFLTTTGYVSGYWAEARDWSGLADPGLMLLGLAAIGGGAATTAGGIKLIRAYALLRHGVREMERIAQPNSVLGVGARTRSLLREGPVIVWSFIMLFIFAILAAVLALTALGLRFDTAIVATVAAIANTGPALEIVGTGGRSFADFTAPQQGILAVVMVIGRIETLALIALFNPQVWRRLFARAQKAGKSSAKTPQSGW